MLCYAGDGSLNLDISSPSLVGFSVSLWNFESSVPFAFPEQTPSFSRNPGYYKLILDYLGWERLCGSR